MNNRKDSSISTFLILIGILLASCSTPEPSPLEIGLVAYWPFNGDASDASGNGHDGIVHGATLTADRHGEEGNAYSFDGEDDYISLVDSPDFDIGAGDMTVLVWAYFEPGPEWRNIISHTNGEVANDGWWWTTRVFSEGKTELICINDTDYYLEMDLIMESWTHLAFVKSGSEITFYVDGTIQGDPQICNDTINDSDGDLKIGMEGSTYGDAVFKGKIDEVRFYNRALTNDEILSLMSSQ
jgi:hypothetical protein